MKNIVMIVSCLFLGLSSFAQQKFDGEHEAVDLGLSVKWASMNIGATSPEDNGKYFAWGEIISKREYYQKNHICANETFPTHKLIEDYGAKGRIVRYPDEIYVGALSPQYDAATMLWGKTWRMPTQDEFKELINRCKWSLKKLNGKEVIRAKGPNGNCIYFPLAGMKVGENPSDALSGGYYWSSSSNNYNNETAKCMRIFFIQPELSSEDIWYGKPIRPVNCSPIPIDDEFISSQRQAVYRLSTNTDFMIEGVSMGESLEDFTHDLKAKGFTETSPMIQKGKASTLCLSGSFWNLSQATLRINCYENIKGIATVEIESKEMGEHYTKIIAELDKLYGTHTLNQIDCNNIENAWYVFGGKIQLIVGRKDVFEYKLTYLNYPYFQTIDDKQQ